MVVGFAEAEYDEYRRRYCNWGRWGDDDEFGTLNHVTPDVRRAAAALVTEGRAVSMARPLDTHASPANPYPAHTFVALEGSGGMLDYVGCFVHGFTQTHIDALCHLRTADGKTFWNGKPFGHSNMPLDHTGTEVLHEDVGRGAQPLEEPATLGSLEIDGDRPFVAVEIEK